MRATLSKIEKLKSKKLIEQLFANGQSVSAFPLRLVYLPTSFDENVVAKTGVSVSKRHFKKAVDSYRSVVVTLGQIRLGYLRYRVPLQS